MSQQTDQIYDPGNVPLFEAIYGENLISLGRLDAMDNMFSDVDLRKLKVLNVGFDLGGVAFYLAKKYQIGIAGVEINDWMVDYAKLMHPNTSRICWNFQLIMN
jgi:phosphoethanolamine N-methyltransferase